MQWVSIDALYHITTTNLLVPQFEKIWIEPSTPKDWVG
jgi:hypothetical protein